MHHEQDDPLKHFPPQKVCRGRHLGPLQLLNAQDWFLILDSWSLILDPDFWSLILGRRTCSDGGQVATDGPAARTQVNPKSTIQARTFPISWRLVQDHSSLKQDLCCNSSHASNCSHWIPPLASVYGCHKTLGSRRYERGRLRTAWYGQNMIALYIREDCFAGDQGHKEG